MDPNNSVIKRLWCVITLVLLNLDMPCLCKNVDPDQLASEEANYSGSTLFGVKCVNLYLQPGSSKLIG